MDSYLPALHFSRLPTFSPAKLAEHNSLDRTTACYTRPDFCRLMGGTLAACAAVRADRSIPPPSSYVFSPLAIGISTPCLSQTRMLEPSGQNLWSSSLPPCFPESDQGRQ